MWQLSASLKSSLKAVLVSQSNKLASIIATSNKTSAASRASNLVLTVVQGVFLTIANFLDTAGVTDTTSISVGKNLDIDYISISDAVPTNFIGKNPATESLTIGDTLDRTVAYYRDFSDPISITDDIDGAASLEDDQVAQFFKNLGTEALNISDAIPVNFIGKNPDVEQLNIADALTTTMVFIRTLTETPTVSDTGSLLFITYVDSSYFSGDYVGSATTF